MGKCAPSFVVMTKGKKRDGQQFGEIFAVHDDLGRAIYAHGMAWRHFGLGLVWLRVRRLRFAGRLGPILLGSPRCLAFERLSLGVD